MQNVARLLESLLNQGMTVENFNECGRLLQQINEGCINVVDKETPKKLGNSGHYR